MSPLTFVFIGRSGCGKGTQADLLQKKLKEMDPENEIMYLETGARFREFLQGEGYSNKLSLEIYKTGERQPDFLATWMWADIVINSIEENNHILFDGITRSLPEAMTFATAMEFYKRKPYIVYLDVSRGWSEERLTLRGRSDDLEPEQIKKRLDWFERDTMPAVEYFKTSDKFSFIEVNGEQPIDKVHRDVLEKLGW